MNRGCGTHILRSLELADALRCLADDGERESLDDGCVLLYGVIRDCSYKIRLQAEKELAVHKALAGLETGRSGDRPVVGSSPAGV
jgi:hypothetical protein